MKTCSSPALLVAALFTLAVWAPPAAAQPSRDPVLEEIQIDHTNGLVTHIRNGKVMGEVQPPNLATHRYEVVKGSQVVVRVVNANPLLYKYGDATTKDFDIEAVKGLDQLTTALTSMAGTLNTLASQVADLDSARAAGAGADALMAAPAREAACLSLVLNGDFESLRAAVNEVHRLTDGIPRYVEQSYTSPKSVTTAVGQWNLSALEAILVTIQKTLNKLRSAYYTDPKNDVAQGCFMEVRALLSDISDARAALDKLESFQKLAAGLLEDVEVHAFDTDPLKRREISFKITQNTDLWPKGLVNGRHVGDVKVDVETYQPVPFSVGPALVYSFVKDPEFEAAEGDDDILTIAKKEGEVNAFEGAVMVQFAPRAWDFVTFKPVVQFGVAPNDKLGILLGAGFQTAKNLVFGAGIIAQEVNELAEGLTVGQTIDSADDVKLDEHFDYGLYLHISVPVAGGKK